VLSDPERRSVACADLNITEQTTLVMDKRESHCRFYRDGKEAVVVIEYPQPTPSLLDEEALVSDVQDKKLVCPGCSDQDVVLGRCHGSLLAAHVSKRFPGKCAPSPHGMQGIFKPLEMIALVDNPKHVFIGRRPPRGVATKSIGVKKTLRSSIFANPFIVSSKAFRLGESLKLYERWLENDYRPLADAEVQNIVDEAPMLSNSIEDILKQMPELIP